MSDARKDNLAKAIRQDIEELKNFNKLFTEAETEEDKQRVLSQFTWTPEQKEAWIDRVFSTMKRDDPLRPKL